MGTAKSRILILDAPPRHGKSEYFSKHLTAWHQATYPDLNTFLTSYESSFAASWGAQARDLLARINPETEKPYSDLFDLRLDPTNRSASCWSFQGHSGLMRTAGAGGAITGKGAHLLIIDDPIKNAEEAQSPTIRQNLKDWLDSTILTRLEPTGCLILMATRWHREDPTGYLLAKAGTDNGEPILHIHLPAIAQHNDWLGRPHGSALWPTQWPIEKLLRTKRTLPAYWWQAMYQGVPTAHTSTEWPDSYFSPHIWCDEPHWPDISQFDLRILCLDPSKGTSDRAGDYSAIVFLGICRGLLYVDCSMERRPMERIVSDMISWADRYRPHHIGIESNAFQEHLARHFEDQTRQTFMLRYPVWKIINKINKLTRIRRLDPYLANHEVRFRASSLGCRLLVDQARDFPLGEHDDALDALEMCIRLVLDTAQQAAIT